MTPSKASAPVVRVLCSPPTHSPATPTRPQATGDTHATSPDAEGGKPVARSDRHRRRRPAVVATTAVGLALVVAGCGSAASSSSTPHQTPLAPAAKVATTP